MNNKELASTLKGLSDAIEIKEKIKEVGGEELDKMFATDILGFKYSPILQDVKIPNKETITTHYSLPNGQPAILPQISRDNNLAVMLLQDLQQNFDFEYRDGVFKVPYEDKASFEGETLGEAVMKSLLFGKAIQNLGVSL